MAIGEEYLSPVFAMVELIITNMSIILAIKNDVVS